MKKFLKWILISVLSLIGVVCIGGLALAFWPNEWKITNKGLTPEQAASLRETFAGPHHTFTTSDGETLFLRRWDPDSVNPLKQDIAVLIFHGFTAYSGSYDMAGDPFSDSGYTTFGLDYRGHGLSSGNRGDSPGGVERWTADLTEAVKHVKELGFSQVVVLGHSLGVAAAMCAANSTPDEIAGLALLSGAYESRPGVSKPMSVFQLAKALSSSVFRPSYRAIEYYREGMTVSEDTLWNYRYTPRFVMMMDVKKLRVTPEFKGPVLVAVGDQDELFSVEKTKEFYDLIPGDKKEFVVLTGATHAKISRENWLQVAQWLDMTFIEFD